jgi:glycosyltransferase involved in cell wall biosynthesis
MDISVMKQPGYLKPVDGSLDLIAACSISIIVPVFNEEEVLLIFHQRLLRCLSSLQRTWEVIYIDDGSSDGSNKILRQLHAVTPQIGVLSLSRNFGKENAMSAGLRESNGEAVIIIDADLQDPPELIPAMVSAWQEGAEVVNMQRKKRHGESLAKRVTAHTFYRIMNMVSDVAVQQDVGDYRLLSRRVVNVLNHLPESNRFMKGLFAWVGYKQITLEYDRDPRAAGATKWNYWKLWNFALEGITGFSTAPLKIASYAGFISAVSAFVYATYFLIKTLLVGETVTGFPTLIITILFLGGLQLMASGVIGEYLGRMFVESKNRPLYLVDQYLPPGRENMGFADIDSQSALK